VLISDFIGFNRPMVNCSAGSMHPSSDTNCDVITVHTAGSLKMDLFGTDMVAITNTISINYPGLLRKKTLELVILVP
jgi:hypothetical protein